MLILEGARARARIHADPTQPPCSCAVESYQRLKVKFERDVAGLEQQLEAMKFTYLLNKGETRSLGDTRALPTV